MFDVYQIKSRLYVVRMTLYYKLVTSSKRYYATLTQFLHSTRQYGEVIAVDDNLSENFCSLECRKR